MILNVFPPALPRGSTYLDPCFGDPLGVEAPGRMARKLVLLDARRQTTGGRDLDRNSSQGVKQTLPLALLRSVQRYPAPRWGETTLLVLGQELDPYKPRGGGRLAPAPGAAQSHHGKHGVGVERRVADEVGRPDQTAVVALQLLRSHDGGEVEGARAAKKGKKSVRRVSLVSLPPTNDDESDALVMEVGRRRLSGKSSTSRVRLRGDSSYCIQSL